MSMMVSQELTILMKPSISGKSCSNYSTRGISLYASGTWNSSDPTVLKSIPAELRDAQDVLCISEFEHNSATTLEVKWDAKSDVFHIQVSKPPEQTRLTKRQLLSDISKVFDVLGWYAPSTILMKILLQETWESNVGWDDMVSDGIMETWQCWRSELDMVSNKSIPIGATIPRIDAS